MAKNNSEILKRINSRAHVIRQNEGFVSHECKTYKMSWQEALKKASAQIKKELARTDAPVGRGEMTVKPKAKPKAKPSAASKKKVDKAPTPQPPTQQDKTAKKPTRTITAQQKTARTVKKRAALDSSKAAKAVVTKQTRTIDAQQKTARTMKKRANISNSNDLNKKESLELPFEDAQSIYKKGDLDKTNYSQSTPKKATKTTKDAFSPKFPLRKFELAKPIMSGYKLPKVNKISSAYFVQNTLSGNKPTFKKAVGFKKITEAPQIFKDFELAYRTTTGGITIIECISGVEIIKNASSLRNAFVKMQQVKADEILAWNIRKYGVSPRYEYADKTTYTLPATKESVKSQDSLNRYPYPWAASTPPAELENKVLVSKKEVSTDRIAQLLAKKTERTAQKRQAIAATGQTTTMKLTETIHTKTGAVIYTVSLLSRVDRKQFDDLLEYAKSLKGYYSTYSKDGAIPGFIFKTEEQARSFMLPRFGNIAAVVKVPNTAKKTTTKVVKTAPIPDKKYLAGAERDQYMENIDAFLSSKDRNNIEIGKQLLKNLYEELAPTDVFELQYKNGVIDVEFLKKYIEFIKKNPEDFLAFIKAYNKKHPSQDRYRGVYYFDLYYKEERTVLKFLIAYLLGKEGIKVSISFSNSSFSSRCTTTIQSAPLSLREKIEKENKLTGEPESSFLVKLADKVKHITTLFLRNNSDSSTDYFDVNYYFRDKIGDNFKWV